MVIEEKATKATHVLLRRIQDAVIKARDDVDALVSDVLDAVEGETSEAFGLMASEVSDLSSALDVLADDIASILDEYGGGER